jgi:hypothetical protein
MDFKIGDVTAPVEAVAHYNLLLTQAIFDALVAKGLLTKEEFVEQIQRLKRETELRFHPLQ